MSTHYAAPTKRAYVTLRRKGAAVTFTQTIPGTYDAATDTYGPNSTVTVTGYAVRDQGNPQTYDALGLSLSEAPTLIFGSVTAGSLPALGAKVTWNAIVYTVRDVQPVDPDGQAIIAMLVVAR